MELGFSGFCLKMGSKWKKAKVALGLNLCMFVPRTLDDESPPPSTVVSERLSDAALLSSRQTTPVQSFNGLKLSKSSSKSSKVCCVSFGLSTCCCFLLFFVFNVVISFVLLGCLEKLIEQQILLC